MKCGLFDNIISDCPLKVLVELGAFNQVICQQMALIYPDTFPPPPPPPVFYTVLNKQVKCFKKRHFGKEKLDYH